MNDLDFKITLSKALERQFAKNRIELNDDFIDIYTTLPICGLYIEYTGIFTRSEWNTYRAVLHLQIPLRLIDLYEKYHSIILREAKYIWKTR